MDIISLLCEEKEISNPRLFAGERLQSSSSERHKYISKIIVKDSLSKILQSEVTRSKKVDSKNKNEKKESKKEDETNRLPEK